MKNKRGITLIALIITIVVLLILAGVSMNAVIGDNGIITQAQMSTIATRVANYKEEFEMNLLKDIDVKNPISSKENITVLNENMKEYIPLLEESDYSEFGIVAGELYYLGDNDMFKKACKTQGIKMREEEQTVEEFVNYVENKALEKIIINMAGENFKYKNENGEEAEKGIKLYDKKFDNGNKWNIITEVDNNETKAIYGTGWYYIKEGSTIDKIGKLKNSYIINYDTKKAVRFNSKIHTILAYGCNLAVKDKSLVFNIDPINMSDTSSWGDATLVGFNPDGDYDASGNLISGWYESGIKLDGVDDQIKFNAGSDFSKGFTLSFYGKYLGGGMPYFAKQPDEVSDVKNLIGGSMAGLSSRFSIQKNNFAFNVSKNRAESKWSYNDKDDNNGNLECNFEKELKDGEDVYIDCVFESNKNTFYVYKDGEFIDSSVVDSKYWNGGNIWKFGGKDIFEEESIICRIGARCAGNPATWEYGKLDFYALRMYNKPLTENEIVANYNATVSYHNILVNGGTAETGGETGGEDLENIY